MEEVQVKVEQKPGVIKSNFNEIREALEVQMTAYTSLEITEDNTKERKADLATLRKIRKAVDDKRKEIKKEYNKPLDDFENEVKAVLEVIDKPISMIDGKLKLFEENRIAAKKEHIKELYNENIGSLERFLPFDLVFNPKWTNATSKDQDVLFDLSQEKLKVKTDLEAIDALDSEVRDEAIEAYIRAGNNLTAAIQRHNQYLADKNKVVEQVKETVPEEIKPKAEAIGTLNDMVNLTKTVTFIISKDDAEDVENLLKVSGISYRIMEG